LNNPLTLTLSPEGRGKNSESPLALALSPEGRGKEMRNSGPI